MSLDQQGYLWLSEPWIAAFAVLVAIGLVLWSHLRLMGEDLNRPATGRRVPGVHGRRRD